MSLRRHREECHSMWCVFPIFGSFNSPNLELRSMTALEALVAEEGTMEAVQTSPVPINLKHSTVNTFLVS